MNKKPRKYGILIRLLADCDKWHVLNMEVYSDKRLDMPTVQLIKHLISPISKSGWNVTTNRFYTLVPLTEELYQNHGLPLVGTMQFNRRFILKEIDERPLYSSMLAELPGE